MFMKKNLSLSVFTILLLGCGYQSNSNYKSAQDSIDEQRYVDSAMNNLNDSTSNNSYQYVNDQGYVELNGSVSCSSTSIVIENKNDYDYFNSKIVLNNDFEIKNIQISAGQSVVIELMDFADSDGNRFTQMKKPQSLYLYCNLESGNEGFLSAIWE